MRQSDSGSTAAPASPDAAHPDLASLRTEKMTLALARIQLPPLPPGRQVTHATQDLDTDLEAQARLMKEEEPVQNILQGA